MAYQEYKVLAFGQRAGAARAAEPRRTRRPGEAGEHVRDWSDESVADEDSGLSLKEADQDTTLLQQVRAALQRIENGNYGRCQVDGRPIREKRLKQIPWAIYCLKHQGELEGSSQPPATL